MEALTYSFGYNRHFIYWSNNFCHLAEYPKYRGETVAYEPDEDIVIPGEFL